MKILISALLSVALLLTLPAESPKNFTKLETKTAHTELSGQSESLLTEKPVVEVEKPQAQVSESHSEKQPTPAVTPVAVATPVISTPKAQAQATLKDLGHEDAWYAVEYIGFKESSWNPTAINSIGACGLFQALPCSKLKCELSNVDCQVRWATKYATTRYGSWHQAYAFWKANNWW